MPNKPATKTKARVTTSTRVATVAHSQLTLSGAVTVYHQDNRMSKLVIALDGMQPPLVIEFDRGPIAFGHPDGSLIQTINDPDPDAVATLQEIGLYVLMSGGISPRSREALL